MLGTRYRTGSSRTRRHHTRRLLRAVQLGRDRGVPAELGHVEVEVAYHLPSTLASPDVLKEPRCTSTLMVPTDHPARGVEHEVMAGASLSCERSNENWPTVPDTDVVFAAVIATGVAWTAPRGGAMPKPSTMP